MVVCVARAPREDRGNEPSSCPERAHGLGEARGAPTEHGWLEGHARAWLPEQGWELRTGPCEGHTWVSKGCRWGAMVRERKSVLLGRDGGSCGMWRAEAVLKDGADVGRAPRACKALEAGGWRLGGPGGSEVRVPGRERGVAGSWPEMAAGRGKVQQVSKPARGGKEGGTESASRLSTWVRSLAGPRGREGGAGRARAGRRPLHTGALSGGPARDCSVSGPRGVLQGPRTPGT